jgi:hypothetical protein
MVQGPRHPEAEAAPVEERQGDQEVEEAAEQLERRSLDPLPVQALVEAEAAGEEPRVRLRLWALQCGAPAEG